IIVRSRSIVGTIGAGLQTLIGGNITILTDLCEKTRQHALELCVQHAEQLGANAIIGLRYDATEIMQGVTEVLCYGTGVLVGAGLIAGTDHSIIVRQRCMRLKLHHMSLITAGKELKRYAAG